MQIQRIEILNSLMNAITIVPKSRVKTNETHGRGVHLLLLLW